jgi:hypothetical protein
LEVGSWKLEEKSKFAIQLLQSCMKKHIQANALL